MQTIREGVEGLSLIAKLNLDRFLVLSLIGGALFASSYMVTM